MTQTLPAKKTQNPNSFSHILINIVIPVFILNKSHKIGLNPQFAVIFALSFPLISGAYSFFKEGKMNFISLLGLLNILISGTLTLLALGGIWFAVKEAAFPLLIGVFVFASSFGKNPFFESLFLNPAAFDTDLIQQKLDSDDKKKNFHQLMKKATQWLSLSFLMSALLNFILAIRIFSPLAENLSTEEKQHLLNQQLGQMTMYSLGVILVPSVIFLGTIIYFTMNQIKNLTGLTTEDLFTKQN